jgi:CRP/FNR family transcriptional regulator
MTRDEIARYLGLALETVSRGFSRLQDAGVIEARGRRVRVLSQAALHAAANGCEAEAQQGGNPQPRRRDRA